MTYAKDQVTVDQDINSVIAKRISHEEKNTIIKESVEFDQNSESTDTSLLLAYHKYMALINSEQIFCMRISTHLLTIRNV
jgi:hypothetical protein